MVGGSDTGDAGSARGHPEATYSFIAGLIGTMGPPAGRALWLGGVNGRTWPKLGPGMNRDSGGLFFEECCGWRSLLSSSQADFSATFRSRSFRATIQRE